jgi:hypothetical protein
MASRSGAYTRSHSRGRASRRSNGRATPDCRRLVLAEDVASTPTPIAPAASEVVVSTGSPGVRSPDMPQIVGAPDGEKCADKVRIKAQLIRWPVNPLGAEEVGECAA